MTDAELQQIEDRASAAHPGPWMADEDEVENREGETVFYSAEWAVGGVEAATFAAAAREDVPNLIAEVRRLRAERAKMLGGPVQRFSGQIGGNFACDLCKHLLAEHSLFCPDDEANR